MPLRTHRSPIEVHASQGYRRRVVHMRAERNLAKVFPETQHKESLRNHNTCILCLCSLLPKPAGRICWQSTCARCLHSAIANSSSSLQFTELCLLHCMTCIRASCATTFMVEPKRQFQIRPSIMYYINIIQCRNMQAVSGYDILQLSTTIGSKICTLQASSSPRLFRLLAQNGH